MIDLTNVTQSGFAQRIRALLPAGWFPAAPSSGEVEQAPVLNALLQGFGAILAPVATLFAYVEQQSRLATMSGAFLDILSQDFFGGELPRLSNESDDAFRTRIKAAMFSLRNTRLAVEIATRYLAGEGFTIIEPRNASDCKGRGSMATPAAGGGYGYGPGGMHYGSLTAQNQIFIIIPSTITFIPSGTDLSALANVLAGGVVAWLRGSGSTDFGGDIL